MTTTAQEALKAFLDDRKKTTIVWSSLTETQKQAYIFEKEGLEIAFERETYLNQLELEAQAETNAQARREQSIAYLKNQGFACDNSLSDWKLLYNRPDIFGNNWLTQAEYQFSLGRDIDYFLSIAYQLWQEYTQDR